MKDLPFVQHAESLKALTEQAKAILGELVKMERLTLHKAYDLGCVLGKLRARCGRGDWLPALTKLGLSTASAYDYIAIANLGLLEVSKFTSIRDCLILSKIKGEEKEITGQAVTDEAITERGDRKSESQSPETSSSQASPQANLREPGDEDQEEIRAKIRAVLCARCRRTGVASCDGCRVKVYKIHSGMKLKGDRPRTNKHKAKSGTPLYDWIGLNQCYVKMVRILSDINSKAPVRLLAEGEKVIHDLGNWRKQFEPWAERATGQKVPQP
jgi:hypothetical protein